MSWQPQEKITAREPVSPYAHWWLEHTAPHQGAHADLARSARFLTLQGPDLTDLEPQLRTRAVDTVLIAGVATNVCCESTARDAMMRGFRTVMVSDANAANTQEEHAASLTTFYLYFGDVQTTDQVIDNLSRSSGVGAAAQ